MDLFIIRRGRSANNALADQRDREVGPPLTDVGNRQAQLFQASKAWTCHNEGAGHKDEKSGHYTHR